MKERTYNILAITVPLILAAAILSFAVVYRAGYDAATAELNASVPQNSCRASCCCFQAEK